MRTATLISLILFSLSAPAAKKSYLLQMQVSINDKVVSAPQLAVQEGVKGSITQASESGENMIEVIATESMQDDTKGILLEAIVSAKDGQGKRVVLSKPKILTIENEQAEVTIVEKDEKGEDKKLSFSVVVKKL